MLVGAGQGLLSTTIYTVEVVNKQVRGSFSVFEGVSRSFGVILIYSLGSVLQWYQTAYIGMVFPLIAFILLFMTPESPFYLVHVGKTEEALISLRKLNDGTNDLEEELKVIKNSVLKLKENNNANENRMIQFFQTFHKHPELYKPFLIVTVMRWENFVI